MQNYLVLLAALLFVPVTTLCAADGYPEFRWDRVPLYAHLSIGDGLKPEQYDFLADHFDLITFPLACFLVAAERNSYFCYKWGWLGEHGSYDWYPELDKPVGPPKVEAERDGWTYRREFEHAKVVVDLENKEAQIDWKR